MLKETIIVSNPHGMHARPSAIFAKLVKEFESKVIVINNGAEIEIKGMMSVLTAGLKYQSKIELVCEGKDEIVAMDKLKEAFSNRFGE
jgi:phosphocarrier protein HPr